MDETWATSKWLLGKDQSMRTPSWRVAASFAARTQSHINIRNWRCSHPFCQTWEFSLRINRGSGLHKIVWLKGLWGLGIWSHAQGVSIFPAIDRWRQVVRLNEIPPKLLPTLQGPWWGERGLMRWREGDALTASPTLQAETRFPRSCFHNSA